MKLNSILTPLITLLSLTLAHPARAASISMTNNDALGSTSFNAKGNWNSAAAPGGGNDYFTANFGLRTPPTSTAHGFAGDSLTLQAPNAGSYSLLVKSTVAAGSSWTMTVNNFTNAGGLLRGGGNTGSTTILTGNVFAVTANSTLLADQCSWVVNSPLAGSGILTNNYLNNQLITYGANNSAFTGTLLFGTGAGVIFAHPLSAPGNPATPTPGQITTSAAMTIQDTAGISLTNGNGGITMGGNLTIATINAGTNTIISETISDNGSGFSVTKNGAGTLTLSGSNYFSGGLIIGGFSAGSTLRLGNSNAVGLGPITITGGNNLTLDNISGATMTLPNNNSQTWNNSFGFAGSQSLDMGSGTVSLGAGNITVTVSNNNLTVGTVYENVFGYALTKAGAGTLTLNGGGYYNGTTTISNGVLALAGIGAPLTSTNIFIATNATLNVTAAGGLTLATSQTLSGSGTVLGSITDSSGTVISPGGSTTAGTLTINGSLTLNGAGALNFDLSSTTTTGGGTNDLIVVTGLLNLASPTTTMNIAGFPSTGTYTLIQYGTFAGDVANVSGPVGYVITNNTALKAIQIIKTRAPALLTWLGDGAANLWDSGFTADWLQSGTNQVFTTGDSVTFDDSGSTVPAISLTGTILPAATTVTGSQTYDFTGSGISSGTLTKTGSGTLILENDNTYTGATVISGGTVQVGNTSGASGGAAGTLGSGAVTNTASLVYARADSTTLASPIYGSGTVTVASGTVAAPGSNYYSGATFINGGIALLQNSTGLGDTNGGITVASGGQLYMVANVDVGLKALTLAGTGPDGNGALRKGFAGPTTFFGPVTLTADTTLNVDGGATLTLAHTNGVNGASANANLTLAGGGAGIISNPLVLGSGTLTVNGGTWTVAPSNNFSGLTTINGGTLRISGPGSLGPVPPTFNATQVTLNGGALGASTNVTLNDGKIGISINANSFLATPAGVTLTLSNEISGAANLTKTGGGTVVLNGSNTFSGQLYIDTFINHLNGSDGMTVIANPAALSGMPASLGTPSIFINNNTAAGSTLGIDGSAGSVTIAPDIFLRGRGVAVANIQNLAGNNTITGGITISTGGAMYIQSDSGTLTLGQTFPYLADAAIGSARSLTFSGAGNIVLSGGLQNANSYVLNVTKSGPGTLSLPGTNSSTGTTTVSGGLFIGTGLILGPVTVQSAGVIAAGTTNTIGTLTISNSLTLAGTTIVKLNKAAGTNDQFVGPTTVTYGGTLVVTNLAGPLAIGNTFSLFTASSATGNFTNIVNATGNNSIGFNFNPTTGVLSVVSGLPSTPTNLTYSVSGNTVSLNWPANYLGWILQAQTNSLTVGLNTNWTDWPGSAAVTSTNIAINPASPAVFFRLRYP